MAYTTIDKPTDYFNTKLYTGNNTTDTAITGIGFQPDWVWVKRRSSTQFHGLYDSVRGATKQLASNSNNAEDTNTESLKSFDSDGFTIGTSARLNASSETYVAWNWLAGGSASSNSDGDTNTSVSANTTSGFSIVKWTGDGGATTLGHGLGAVPKWILVKTLDRSENWVVYHVGNDATAPEDKSIRLDGTNAVQDNNTHFNDTAPTSSVFSVGASNGVNPNGEDQIAYCFAEKKGYSKFGSYTGNGSTDGPFIYTGFKPAFVMQKSTAVQGWQLQDNKREGYNGDNDLLQPHDNAAESGVNRIDILSNGFKVITTDAGQNTSGATYIYMTFAESPFVTSTGIPTTAR